MADPISLAAVAGLIYAGRALSVGSTPKAPVVETPQPPMEYDEVKENLGGTPEEISAKMELGNFADIVAQKRSSGQEVNNMRDRMYDTGRMNNLSPVEKQLVGPGLGVGANVPAYGGHQQLFRVNPINVGAYRLTTLPGRSGPAADVTGGRSAIVGELTHNKPETTAYLPSRLPSMPGRAQGMSGAVPRQEHEKTKRTTNRSETGHRADGLGYNAAKRFVQAQTMPQDPTRFRSDRNDTQFAYASHATPGITNFSGAYMTSAAARVMNKTNDELMAYGFRPEDRRGKANRMGNPGRMNVTQTRGSLTTVRTDSTRVDGRTGPMNGGWTQHYQQKPFHQFNAYKGNENPNSRSLDLAKRQLQNNPLSHHIY